MAAGDPISATVRGAGAISGSAYYPDGWVLDVVYSTVLGPATPDGTKITVLTTAPGYSGGSLTTVSRTIKCTLGLRQYNPNQATFNVVTATNTTVSFVLDSRIHSGETIVSVTIVAGSYGISSNAATLSGGSVTNSSTLTYNKGVGKFVTPQDLEATSSPRVEWAGTHWAAKNSQQFDSVYFTATDETGNSVSSLVTQPIISTQITGANSQGVYAEVWAWDVPLTTLNQGERVKVRAQANPWIGDSSAVLDSDPTADGFAWPGNNCTTLCNLYFLNNKTGGYGTVYAYVDSTVGAGGTVSTTPATARSTPFPTIAAAATAIQTYNNANFSRNNAANGRIRLKDNAAHANTFGATLASIVAGKTWLYVEGDPLNSGYATLSSAVGSGATTAAKVMCDLLCIRGRINMLPGDATVGTATLIFSGAATASNKRLLIGYGVNITMQAANTHPFRGVQWTTLFNATMSNVGASFFNSSSTNGENLYLIAGVVQTGTGSKLYPRSVIGSFFTGTFAAEPATLTNIDPFDGLIALNNVFIKFQTTWQLGTSLAYTRGAAVEGNIFEQIEPTGTVASFWFGNDATTTNLKNVNIWHNLMIGNRTNYFYTDDDATGAINPQKTGTSGHNIIEQRNSKTDTFTRAAAPVASTSSASGRTGGWRFRYQVDNGPEVMLGSDYSAAFTGGPAAGLGERLLPLSVVVQSANDEANVDSARRNMFVNSLAGPSRGGGGDYNLKGTSNSAYNRVAIGKQRNRFDLAGRLRRTDGSGAAGPLERTDSTKRGMTLTGVG